MFPEILKNYGISVKKKGIFQITVLTNEKMVIY